jgi:hypothetical protein
MRHLHITSDNKPYFVRRYTDYIVSRMDNLEIMDSFKDYFYREKIGYPIETLEVEINRYCPEILDDHIAEEVVGKGVEYAKSI